MKTLKEVAQVIVERLQRMNTTIMQGEMTGVIGEDGLSMALQNRWLVPNYDSGYLQINGDAGVIQHLRETAQLPDPAPEPDRLGESRTVCSQHAFRNAVEVSEALTISEIAAPGTGAPAPRFVQQTPATPTSAPPAPAGGPGAPIGVGEDVSVVADGKAYQGKIQSGLNGKYKISFGNERPSDMGREYSEQEINRIQAV